MKKYTITSNFPFSFFDDGEIIILDAINDSNKWYKIKYKCSKRHRKIYSMYIPKEYLIIKED